MSPSTQAPVIGSMLTSALTETAAYRRFFREASLGALKKVAES